MHHLAREQGAVLGAGGRRRLRQAYEQTRGGEDRPKREMQNELTDTTVENAVWNRGCSSMLVDGCATNRKDCKVSFRFVPCAAFEFPTLA